MKHFGLARVATVAKTVVTVFIALLVLQWGIRLFWMWPEATSAVLLALFARERTLRSSLERRVYQLQELLNAREAEM